MSLGMTLLECVSIKNLLEGFSLIKNFRKKMLQFASRHIQKRLFLK